MKKQSIPVTQLIEAITTAAPKDLAIQSKRYQWNYQTLCHAIDSVAFTIEQHIAGREPVAVLMTQDAPMLATMLALFKLGRIYVPLDPAMSLPRLKEITLDLGDFFLIADEQNRALSEILCTKHNTVIINEPFGNHQPHTPSQTLNNIAYIIYTSGSTGKPKGVMQSQRNLLEHINVYSQSIHVSSKDRLSLLTSFCFDAALMDIFAALCNGACLCIIPVKDQSARDIAQAIQEQGITIYHSTPTVFRLLCQQLHSPSQWQQIRKVILGGETARVTDFHLFQKWLSPHCSFINGLGPTECTTALQCHLTHQDHLAGETIPVGFPVASCQISLKPIADKQGSGEIIIHSDFLALGYWGQPPSLSGPFIMDSTPRQYRTGDLGYFLPDGQLMFMGRLDQQIKVRGQKVSLSFLRQILLMDSLIQEIEFVCLLNPAGEEQFIALYVSANAIPAAYFFKIKNEKNVAIWPNTFIHIPTLPLTMNGKTDHNALKEIANCYLQSLISPINPEIDHTSALKKIWADTLSCPLKDIEDESNFFALGGHSIAVMYLLTRIKKQFNVEISLRDILLAPIFSKILAKISDTTSIAILESKPQDTFEVASSMQASVMQEEFWLHQTLHPESTGLNLIYSIELQGSIQIKALEVALATFIQRHKLTSLFFDYKDSTLFMDIKESLVKSCQLYDFSMSSSDAALKQWEQLVSAEQCFIFDLKAPPLARFHIVRLSENQTRVLINWHHIIADGYSEQIFINDLATAYNVYSTSQSPAAVQYVPSFSPPRAVPRKQTTDFWQHYLKGCMLQSYIPQDFISTGDNSKPSAFVAMDTSELLFSKLQHFALTKNMTLFNLLLAVFTLFLSRFSEEQDIAFFFPIINRASPEHEQCFGCFINVLIFRAQITNVGFELFCQSMLENYLQVMAHHDISSSQLRQGITYEQGIHQNDQSLIFTFHPKPLLNEFNHLKATCKEIPPNSIVYDMGFDLYQLDHKLQIKVTYNKNKYHKKTISHLLHSFLALIENALQNTAIPMQQLSLLTAAQQDYLVSCTHNASYTPPTQKTNIYERFEQYALKTPKAIAIYENGIYSSYETVQKKVNHIAYNLKQLGISKGARVCVVVDTSADLILIMLALFKNAMVYVPIDPNNPESRIELIVTTCEPQLIIWDGIEKPGFAKHIAIVLKQQLLVASHESNALFTCIEKPHPSQALYIFHTSGSTGIPKGAMIAHENLHAYIDWAIKELKITTADRGAVFSSPGFDVFIHRTMLLLAGGASLYLCPSSIQKIPTDFRQWLIHYQITLLNLFPDYAKKLLELTWPKTCSLRLIIIGGEKIKHFYQGQWPFILWNGYGPTETTITATKAQIYPYPFPQNHIPPIGKPIAGMYAYIFNRYLQPAPIGAIGELYLGGACVGLGYYNDPEKTKQHFIPNPMMHDEPRILYKTGDKVRLNHLGELEYIGRNDQQFNLHGVRIEQGEIEYWLAKHSDVVQYELILLPDDAGNEQMVAFIKTGSCQNEQPTLNSSVLMYLNEKLPRTMIPTLVITLKDFPYLPNGKIDRKRLLSMYQLAKQSRPQKSQVIENETIKQLCHIWQHVLGFYPELHKNFYLYGGTSLKAIALLLDINKHFSLHFKPAWIMEHTTISQQAKSIDDSCHIQRKDYSLFNAHGENIPLVLIPPIFGGLMTYKNIALALESQQPCCILEYDEQINAPLSEKLQHYVECINALYPNQNLILGGWSNGGIMAYLLSQQLNKNSERVSSIILWDSDIDQLVEQRDVEPITETTLQENPFYTYLSLEQKNKYKSYLINEMYAFQQASISLNAVRLLHFKAKQSSERQQRIFLSNYVAHYTEQEIKANHYTLLQPKAIKEMMKVLSNFLVHQKAKDHLPFAITD